MLPKRKYLLKASMLASSEDMISEGGRKKREIQNHKLAIFSLPLASCSQQQQ
jgi:hypothetical protein